MEDNSTTDRPKPRAVGTAVQRKTPLSKRLTNTFVGGDAKGVWGYVIASVLVPAAQDMFADAVKEGVERMIYGDGNRSSGRSSGGSGRSNGSGNVAYNKFGGNSTSKPDPRERDRRGARGSNDIGENVMENRAQAEDVLDQMVGIINKYGQVSVSDFYEMVNLTGTYTDEKWGWTDLSRAGIFRARRGGGFVIDLPKPEPLT